MTTDTPPTRTRLWHAAYARWYDHRAAGHRVRAFIWGLIADAVCPRGAKEWNQ